MDFDAGDGANGDPCVVAGAGSGVGAGFGGLAFATTLLVAVGLVAGCGGGAAGRGAGLASATTAGVVATLSDIAFELLSCTDWGWFARTTTRTAHA